MPWRPSCLADDLSTYRVELVCRGFDLSKYRRNGKWRNFGKSIAECGPGHQRVSIALGR